MGPIVFWNRAKKREETELVYGDAGIKFLYGTVPGQKFADWFLSAHLPSRLYGAYQASSLSKRKVAPFIQAFRIPMEEYEGEKFASFNDFFIRKFKQGQRPFESEPGRMPAFAEARYLAYERIQPDQLFPVKGTQMTAANLLGVGVSGVSGGGSVDVAGLAREFEEGPLLLARLCPVDYHRYHYPDSGKTLSRYRVPGKLHSVNPAALRYKDEIFATNERYVSLLETRSFGKLAYIEVGAMMVGKIVQTHPEDQPFERGAEKGYFLFGASTVIVLGQPGAWKPDADLLEQTGRERETYVRLGDGIAGLRA